MFVRVPAAGAVKSRLVPPFSPDGSAKLYLAFLQDLTARLLRTRLRPTIFVSGGTPADVAGLFPANWPALEQQGEALGERLAAAFEVLLQPPGSRAVVIGSDSPDLPLTHVKRAFRLLKHRDVVLGPAMDGGYYLLGLRANTPALFQDIPWGTAAVFARTVDAVRAAGLSLALTPPWYDVDDAASLDLLKSMCAARRVAGGERLVHVERTLEDIGG
jgi:rSAM/selenodomain-associated transferase 1